MHSIATAIFRLSKPDQYTLGFSIDLLHYSNLLAPLDHAGLVDTQLVYPDGPRFVAPTELLECAREILCDREGHMVASNRLCFSVLSPYIRQSVEVRRFFKPDWQDTARDGTLESSRQSGNGLGNGLGPLNRHFSIIYEDLGNECRPNSAYLRHGGQVKYCTA
jgi:hypothetical protein